MPKKYTDERVLEICELYREGKTMRQIAAKLGCSYGGVNRTLVRRGVPLWPRGPLTDRSKGHPAQAVSE